MSLQVLASTLQERLNYYTYMCIDGSAKTPTATMKEWLEYTTGTVFVFTESGGYWTAGDSVPRKPTRRSTPIEVSGSGISCLKTFSDEPFMC